jgi:hypothetical protein
MSRSWFVVVGCAALALVAAGCSSATLSADEYAAQMNEICENNATEIDKIPQPESLEEMAEATPLFAAALGEAADRMEELEPPTEIAEQADRFVALGEQQSELMVELGNAAAAGDAEAFDEISTQMGENASESDAIAIAIGASACTSNG